MYHQRRIDLKAGQTIDGIGGYTTHGSIAAAEESNASRDILPFGLVTNKAVRDVKGRLLTYDDIGLDRAH